MMRYPKTGDHLELAYGRTNLAVDLFEADYQVILPRGPATPPATAKVAAAALQKPIGTPSLADLVHAGESIAVLVPDTTRPCPTADLLPVLLAELERARVKDKDIVVVSGLGSHRRQTTEERQRLVGAAAFERLGCIDSDPNDVTLVGRTGRGTPVEVFTPVARADRRLALGSLEYHYFAGYSGGYKALIPGMCSLKTIEANHSLMVNPGAEAGRIAGNPVREDIDEAGAMGGLDFMLNVILDEEHRAVTAVAGHPLAAHHEGCARLNQFGRSPLPWLADVVMVSAGGFPKDINLYQAQKALDSARLAVRPGGTIILIAECAEGLGHGLFAEWMLSGATPDQLIERIQTKFRLGAHKAAAVALAMKRATVVLVSSLPANQVRAMGFVPCDSPSEALLQAIRRRPPPVHVALIPAGASMLPVLDPGIIPTGSSTTR